MSLTRMRWREKLVEEIHTDHGGVDVLVNSAGYPLPCPLEQVALSDLRQLFETNVVATLHLSQLVLSGMRARGSGRIVTIGSTGGRFTSPGAGAYHIVKYGVEALVVVAGRRGGAVRCSSRVDRSHRGANALRQFAIRDRARLSPTTTRTASSRSAMPRPLAS